MLSYHRRTSVFLCEKPATLHTYSTVAHLRSTTSSVFVSAKEKLLTTV